jgi:GxxExxY protein
VTPVEEITHAIVSAARVAHLELGPGFIESIYARALGMELKKQGLHVEREKVIKIWYGLNIVGTHRLDLVVENAAIVELKASRGIVRVHMAQMNSYLHATDYPIGLILNFGMPELEYELVLSPKTSASAIT